ncbi:hypothetical protein FACS1894158_03300 [Betaproteobacteria bacterium]|nr:hypothetical protein FACS1894158_03300 [Betaproteobacteria bacterium]
MTCPVCEAQRVDDAEKCATCGWDFSPVLGDQRELDKLLEEARKTWQAAEKERAKAATPPETTGAEPPNSESFTNSLGMEFILIPAGSFMMGSDGDSDEKPQHSVTISQPFYLGKYQVTQAQWKAVTGNNPSRFKGERNPVEEVSWKDVQKFIQRLEAKEGTNKYRLPTEAEWEYAARAGTTSVRDDDDEFAWYGGNSGTHPVGQKKSNPQGLYDMHGNVWEWVNDLYGAYPNAVSEPRVPSTCTNHRVVRGGSWSSDAGLLRSGIRCHCGPDFQCGIVGFRLAVSPGL